MNIKNIINNKNIVICVSSGNEKNMKRKYLRYLEEDRRVISIGEFNNCIEVNNWVELEEKEDITKTQLYNASTRMNPDTIVIDLNGRELVEILNSEGINNIMFSKAYSIKDMMQRLETMYLMGSSEKSLEQIRSAIKSKIDYIIYGDEIYDIKNNVYEEGVKMSKEEAIIIAKNAIQELLQYAEDGLIWGGDGTEETEREIEKDKKAYEKAIETLTNNKTIKIELKDNYDGETLGYIETDEYTLEELKERIEKIRDEWYEKGIDYCMTEYLEEKLGITIIKPEKIESIEI